MIDICKFVDSLGPLSISKDDAAVAIAALMAATKLETIEECAVAAEMQDRAGYEWVHGSVWDKISLRAGAQVRKLAGPGAD